MIASFTLSSDLSKLIKKPNQIADSMLSLDIHDKVIIGSPTKIERSSGFCDNIQEDETLGWSYKKYVRFADIEEAYVPYGAFKMCLMKNLKRMVSLKILHIQFDGFPSEYNHYHTYSDLLESFSNRTPKPTIYFSQEDKPFGIFLSLTMGNKLKQYASYRQHGSNRRSD